MACEFTLFKDVKSGVIHGTTTKSLKIRSSRKDDGDSISFRSWFMVSFEATQIPSRFSTPRLNLNADNGTISIR